jgi:hypothetical protein
MKLIVSIANGSDPVKIEGTCRLGEYSGDAHFDQPLVGDDILARVLHAWVAVDEERRTFGIIGVEGHAHVVLGFVAEHGDHKGVNIREVYVDDTTWLHPLQKIKEQLPYPSFDWEVELVNTTPTVKTAPPMRDVPQYRDPSFWVDEHSDTL